MFLDTAAESAVRQRAAGVEAATGVEVVAAVISRADSYPEIPWKAFALGGSVAALAAVVAAAYTPGWNAFYAVAEAAVAVLGAGAALALATVWLEPLARLFLPRARGEAEVLQAAQAMFLDAGLHRTRRGDGMLLLVSLFEHQVVVLPDPRLRDRLGPDQLAPVVAAVVSGLGRGALRDALLEGLAKLEETLVAGGIRPQAGDANEIPDAIIQRRGPA